LGLYDCFFFFSSRRRHTRCSRDWSSDVCSSDLHQVRAAIRAVVTKRNESLWRVNVNAVFFIREMRPARAACGQDELGVAALGGNPHEDGVAGLPAIEAAVLAVVGVAAQQHDARAVRRPHRIAVDRQRFGELLGLAAACGNLPKLPALIVPTDIGDPPAVGRPSRLKFRRIAAGQALWLAVRKVEGVKIDRKSTRLNSSHGYISYAVFCLKKKNTTTLSSF